MSTKQCTKCGTAKDIAAFETDRRYKSGYRSQCNTCRYTAPAAKRAKLASHLRLRYGLDVEQWEQLLKDQNYVCAICKLPESRVTRPNAKKYLSEEKPRLSVDHDHITGTVRGLLCYKCNIGIGHLQDSIENLKEAIAYLEKWSSKQ